jgi:ABC-type taurine transport system ATPase subunit
LPIRTTVFGAVLRAVDASQERSIASTPRARSGSSDNAWPGIGGSTGLLVVLRRARRLEMARALAAEPSLILLDSRPRG